MKASDSKDDEKNAPLAWTTMASSHLIKDRWLSVRADVCRTVDETEIAPYYVLEYPDWVNVVAIDADDCLILVEQYRHALGGLSLELPAGAIEPSDVDPMGAGARELLEETGYGSRSWFYITRLSPNPATHNNHFHVVVALDAELQQPPLNDPMERVRVVRVPVRDALDLASSGGIVHAMHIASLLLALKSLGKNRSGVPAPAADEVEWTL
jgi:8-oxo-dGTP pyrophosphatase MutT (NUDIX family)